MQQNQGQPAHKVLPLDYEPFHSIDAYLGELRKALPKGSAASQSTRQALSLLQKIDSTGKAAAKNNERLEALKGQFFQNLQNIKRCLADQDGEQSLKLRSIFQKLEDDLRNQPAFEREEKINSTGTRYLHSVGFDQIVHMINAASVHEPEWMSRTGTLLVLDNNPNTCQALMRRLTREGHTVLTAEDESQTFEYLRTCVIEAILVDYAVFKEALYDFLKKIEKDPIRYVPIIVIGAPENPEILRQITELGVGDYLAKPVNPALLKMGVHAVLEKKYAFERRLERLQEMQRARHEMESAIQDLPDGYAIFDQDSHLVMHNQKLFEFYPHLKKREEMLRGGLTFDKLLEANVSAGIYSFNTKEAGRQWIEEKKANFLLPACQWEETLTSGLVLALTTYRTPDGGGALIAKDISKDKAQHQDLTLLAYHDALTGLPNRKAFYQKLTQSILTKRQTERGLLAVLFLDLDGFKAVNDSYGHEMGDWLLNQVSQRLRRCIRGDDMLARFGGDEFCIILNHAANRNKVKMVAARILKAISQPYIRNDILLDVGVSVGIGVYSLGTEDSESLLKEADAAMYAVKQEGKGKYRFYDEISNESQKPKPAKA
ncbi:MAG: hypothetical protein K0R76_123 [Alphaproteobacteria bacterium]|jgi:diguanylate cyclase (GGDEF)-like protein|nr:hypothetical protein [Alphaproteobacteria bacterium]